jgi:hypothetical protein
MSDAALQELVKKVTESVAALRHDRDAVSALLRFYQIQRPGAVDWPLVASALLVARIHQAAFENDFMLLCCLVADAYHQTNEMKWLCAFDEALSSGKFARIWPLLDELAALKLPKLSELYTANKKKVDDAARRLVLIALAMTLSAVDKDSLCVLTGVKKVEDLADVSKGVVDKIDDKEVRFAKSDANHPPQPQGPRALGTADVALLAKTIGVSM